MVLCAHWVASLINHPLGMQPIQGLLVLLVGLQLHVQQLLLLLQLLMLLQEGVLVGIEKQLLVLHLLHLLTRALLLRGTFEQISCLSL